MTQGQTINVELLSRRILESRITRKAFNLAWMTKRQVFDVLYASYKAEVEYRGRTMAMTDETRRNLARLTEYLAEPKGKFGVFLCGGCGNGKTTLLYTLRTALAEIGSRKWANVGDGIKLVTAKDVAHISKDYDAFRKLCGTQKLAIDDVGEEPREVLTYGNVSSPIIDLLEYRYNNQLFTVVSSNLAPNGFQKAYGERIADRMREMFEIIVFNDKSFR